MENSCQRLFSRTALFIILFTQSFLISGAANSLPAPQNNPAQAVEVAPTPTSPQKSTSLKDRVFEKIGGVKDWVGSVVEQTKNPFLRLLFIFLLGILMSFTPCIYPMIPITMGILQAAAQKSVWRNILAAIFYTTGIAVTFAVLGLVAATGGAQFGHLLSEPIVIIGLVLFLGYFGFSMLGLYEMRLPGFMQQGSNHVPRSSLLSVFLFGALSGTVASPCLSPGLVLLLSIVATIGSKAIGFLYLFVFGVGLCVPLLLLGFFSNSMSLMPRAGMWMIEIKRIFGILLIAMCFYYLNALLPICFSRGLLAGTLVAVGIFMISIAKQLAGKGLTWYRRLLGLLLICIGLFMGSSAVVLWRNPPAADCTQISYTEARTRAIEQKKLLLVDCGASWCISCKELEKKLVKNEKIRNQFPTLIFVAMDCTDPHAKICADFSQKFSIVGFPTVLLIDPQTEQIRARFGEELLEMSEATMIETIKKAL